jgi:hypothetical protein
MLKSLTSLFILILSFSVISYSQIDPQSPAFRASMNASYNQTGNPTGKSGGGEEQVGSSSFKLSIDLLKLPQRNGKVDLSLNYDSGVWHKIKMNPTQNGYLYNILHGFPSPGFSLGFPKILVSSYAGGVQFVDSDNTKHLMLEEQPNGPFGGNTYYETIDATYIKLTFGANNSAVALYPDGTKIEFGVTNYYYNTTPASSVILAQKII